MSRFASHHAAIGLLALALGVAPSISARSQEMPVRERPGGLISIPGAPLPPTDPDAVRNAITLFEPLMEFYRHVGTNRSVGRGYGYLATLYAALGEYSKADQFFDDAQTRLEDSGTPLEIAWLNNNRGLVETQRKLYAASLRSYRRALDLLTSTEVSSVTPMAIVLQNLAATQHLLGDVEAAEGAYLEALDVLRRAGKERDLPFQVTRANLALLYHTMGDYAAAREILVAVLERKDISPSLRYAALNDLAAALSELGEFGEAGLRLKEALALTGEGSSERAVVLTNLASLFVRSNDFAEAQRAGNDALRIAKRTSTDSSRVAAANDATLGAAALGRGDLITADVHLTRARNVFSREIGDREPLALVLRDLSLVAQRRGQTDRAIALARQALNLDQAGLEQILAFGSEAQRLAYRSKASPYDQLANLGDATMVSEAVLSLKGAVLESLLRERALSRKSASRENRERLDSIHALKVELMEKISRGEGDIEDLKRELKSEETALAKSLSLPVPQQSPRPTLAGLQHALGADQALIEIIRFRRLESSGARTPWYGAVIISGGRTPAWVALGPADKIESAINSLLRSFGDGDRGAGRIDTNGDVSALLHDLHALLWEPLARALPDSARRIYVSPDGATHFVPWAALLDERMTFLAERWPITLIGSGRDLVRPSAASNDKTILALAYGLEDLPHTRSEVEELARRGKASGWETTVFLGDDASEAALFTHPHPRILHFATHAGQLDTAATQAIESRLSKNPMYRGYLYLGGAQSTRTAWSNDSAPPFFDDGILTAEEASGLDLGGTWLTVLSACQTGVGDAANGEGVLGLRRGFALAGTENLLFSLWPVNDSAAEAFMSEFYDRLFRTNDLSQSFQEAQLHELRRWKESEGITAAVQRAGAFAMTR